MEVDYRQDMFASYFRGKGQRWLSLPGWEDQVNEETFTRGGKHRTRVGSGEGK